MKQQARRKRGGRGAAASQIFANFDFWWTEKKIVLKWKIVQNYKSSWNSSKFIGIYNIVINLDTRDNILSVMNPEWFSHF